MLLIILLYFFLKKLFNPLHCLVNYCKHFSQEDTSLPPCDGSYEIQSLRLAIISLVEKNQNLVNSERDIFKEAAHEIKSPVAILKTRIDLFKHDSSYTRAEFSKEAQDDINTITRYLKELLFLKSVERDLLEEKKILNIEDQCSLLQNQFKPIVEQKQLHIHAIRNGNFVLNTQPKALQRVLLAIFENVFIHAEKKSEINITTDSQERSITILNKICNNCDDKLFSSNIGSKIIERLSSQMHYSFKAEQHQEEYYLTKIIFFEDKDNLKCPIK